MPSAQSMPQSSRAGFLAGELPADHCREFLSQRQRHYSDVVGLSWTAQSYRHLIEDVFKTLVPARRRILELGCGIGDLLAALRPTKGVGVDFCDQAIRAARQRHPDMDFACCEATLFRSQEPFDYIVLSDLINDLPDVQNLFEHLRSVSHAGTRLVINFFNHLWYPVLRTAEFVGARRRTLPQNWLSRRDVANMLNLAGWEVIRMDTRILWPIETPLLATFLNRLVAPFFRPFCLSDFIVARPRTSGAPRERHCTVIIPARNERGNIEAAVNRIPDMGSGIEIILVEGHSKDDTWQEIQRVRDAQPQRAIRAFQQSGIGKGPAVRQALEMASGEVCLILDADLSVAPEDLPKFYRLLRSGMAEVVNGVRLVYPLEHEAMRFLNLIANKFFGLAFGWVLGQPIKDTLCGTKAFFREDYLRIAQNRAHFGDFDPFGDFDLLFGAAKLNLRIVDLPVRYHARVYGETNIRRWRHGWLLLRMLVLACRRLKFV